MTTDREDPRDIDAWHRRMAVLQRQGQPAAAADIARRAAALAPTMADPFEWLMLALLAQARLREAAQAAWRALGNGARSPELLYHLARIYRSLGNPEAAVRLMLRHFADRPKRVAGFLYNGMPLDSPSLVPVLRALCRQGDPALFTLGRLIWRTLRHRAGDAPDRPPQSHQEAARPLPPVIADRIAGDPFLVEALAHTILPDPQAEAFLSTLRTRLVAAGPGLAPVLRPLLAALALHAFGGEYALQESPQDPSLADQLADQLTDQLTDQLAGQLVDSAHPPVADPEILALALAGLACLRPLSSLDNWKTLATLEDWPDWFRPIHRRQILDLYQEQRLIADLPVLTPIRDPVSRAVQAQYNAHPFPRWTQAESPLVDTLPALFQRVCHRDMPSVPPRILIAGAGSGRHPLLTARRFPGVPVMAIDIAAHSLAIGRHRAMQSGIDSLSFHLADILELPPELGPFPLIESFGVLHHLGDPARGLARLAALLPPGGLLYVSVYSRRARQAVIPTQELFKQSGLVPDAAGIRRFRDQLRTLPASDPARWVMAQTDFYVGSHLRDLVMNVQEHVFDMHALAPWLATAGLRFCAMDAPTGALSAFRERFPQPGAEYDLALWDAFEADHPSLFKRTIPFFAEKI